MDIKLNDLVLLVGKVDRIVEEGGTPLIRLWLPAARGSVVVRETGIHSILSCAESPRHFDFGQRVCHKDGRSGIVIRRMSGYAQDVEIAYQDTDGSDQTDEVYSGDLSPVDNQEKSA